MDGVGERTVTALIEVTATFKGHQLFCFHCSVARYFFHMHHQPTDQPYNHLNVFLAVCCSSIVQSARRCEGYPFCCIHRVAWET